MDLDSFPTRRSSDLGIWGNHKDQDIKKLIKDYHKKGVDGLKFGMMDKQTFLAASAEANRLKLPVANHVGVEDMNAWDNMKANTTSIEHWYGVPDAALHGVQEFPVDMNYSNELHRFRYAGRLWREADQIGSTSGRERVCVVAGWVS